MIRIKELQQSRKHLLSLFIISAILAIILARIVINMRATYKDTTKETRGSAQRLDLPEGIYSGIAWLDEQNLMFLYRPSSATVWNTQVVLYSLSAHSWHNIQLPKQPGCERTRPSVVRRVSDIDVGIIFHCVTPETSAAGERYSLYVWKSNTQRFHLLHDFPDNFKAGPFSLTSNFTNLIQEESVGSGLNNQLYRVDTDGQPERLFPTWKRVRSPAWSPDGKILAFAGTQTYQDRTPIHPLFGFGPIRDLFLFPWDLYLQAMDDGDPEILLTGIQDGFINNWSPDGTTLNFTGNYQRTDGTWLIDVGTRQVSRIWSVRASSAWSPVGSSIALIDHDDEEVSNGNQVFIIHVSNCERVANC